MIDRRAAPCLLPRQWRPWSSYLCLWRGIEGQRQLSIMELLHVSTVRRQSSSVSVASNGWDGPTGFAMLTHETGQRMRIYLYISIQYLLCVGGRVVKGQEGAGTEAFLWGKNRKERDRDCSELIIHKLPSLPIHMAFLCRSQHQHFHIFSQWMGLHLGCLGPLDSGLRLKNWASDGMFSCHLNDVCTMYMYSVSSLLDET